MRDWEEVFKALGEDFEAKYLKDLNEEVDAARKNGSSGSGKKPKPYAPIWLYRSRLEKVLGITGYRVIVTDPRVQHAQKRDIDILTVQVSLQLLEDDCKTVAFETQKPGIAEVTNASSLQMNLGKATSAGLKDCCDEFRIGGNVELIWRNAHSTSSSRSYESRQTSESGRRPVSDRQSQPAPAASRETAQQEAIFKVTPCGAMTEGRNGSYYVPVKTHEGKELVLWFYKDRYEHLLAEPSKCQAERCLNRFDDLRWVWSTGKSVLSLKAQLNEASGRLYFHSLIDSQ